MSQFPSSALSRRQADVLTFIAHFRRAAGYGPALRAIGQAVSIAAVSGVHRHVQRLKAKGYLQRDRFGLLPTCAPLDEPIPFWPTDVLRQASERAGEEEDLKGMPISHGCQEKKNGPRV